MKTLIAFLALVAATPSFAGTYFNCVGRTHKGIEVKILAHYNNDSDIASQEVFDVELKLHGNSRGMLRNKDIKTKNNDGLVGGFSTVTVAGKKGKASFKVVVPGAYFRFGKPANWKTTLTITLDDTAYAAPAVCNAKLDFVLDGITL